MNDLFTQILIVPLLYVRGKRGSNNYFHSFFPLLADDKLIVTDRSIDRTVRPPTNMVASLLSRECDRNVKFCICNSIIALDHGYVFQLVIKDLFIESAQIIGLLEDQGINASD